MKRFLLTLSALLMTITPALAQPTQQQTKQSAPPKPVYIRAGRLFDATSDNMRENMVIVIVGDRIQSVGAASTVTIPSGANVIDLSHATVLPGLIDCHTHWARAPIAMTKSITSKTLRLIAPLPAW